MEKILHLFGNKQEIQFAHKPFRGVHAGKANKLRQHINGLIRARGFIFLLLLSLSYRLYNVVTESPIGINALNINQRVIPCIFIISILLYNHFRLPALILSILPFSIMLLTGNINIQLLGILLFLGIGIYRHISAEQIKKELQSVNVEDHLISEK